MKVSEVLQAASDRLTPETWGQGDQVAVIGVSGRECAAYAIALAAVGLGVQGEEPHYGALDVFRGVVGQWISTWNDRPQTTLRDIHAAFEAAIAIAQEQEQAVQEEVTA